MFVDLGDVAQFVFLVDAGIDLAELVGFGLHIDEAKG